MARQLESVWKSKGSRDYSFPILLQKGKTRARDVAHLDTVPKHEKHINVMSFLHWWISLVTEQEVRAALFLQTYSTNKKMYYIEKKQNFSSLQIT